MDGYMYKKNYLIIILLKIYFILCKSYRKKESLVILRIVVSPSLTSLFILLFFSKMGNCIPSMVSSKEPVIFPMSKQTMNEPESKNVLNTLKINGVVYHVPELTGKIERVKLIYV